MEKWNANVQNVKLSNFYTYFGKTFVLWKIRPPVALSGDDRQLVSMQEFRIFGGVDHMLDRRNKKLRDSKIEHTQNKVLHEFTKSTDI